MQLKELDPAGKILPNDSKALEKELAEVSKDWRLEIKKPYLTIDSVVSKAEEYADRLGVPEALAVARNLAWDAVYWHSPRGFAAEVMSRGVIGEVYTPDIAKRIPEHHKAVAIGVVAKEVDAKRIDFNENLLQRYKSEAAREKAVGEMVVQIDSYCEMVYNHFKKKEDQEWRQLSAKEKKDLLKQAIAVVTNGSRILGIGYQGAKGRHISSGKLKCYALGSDLAVLPQLSFPFGVNFGRKRDRQALIERKDQKSEYSDYEHYMHLILTAFDRLGVGLLQFEDFQGEEAWKVLKWARKNLGNTWVFNDDIEGTAAMVAESLMKMQGEGISLEQSIILFLGAGGAGSGIFRNGWWLIEEEMRARDIDDDKIAKARRIKERIFFFDTGGLLYQQRRVKSRQGRREFREFQLENGMVLDNEEMLEILRYKLGGELGERVTLEDVLELFGENLGEKGSVIFMGTTTSAGTISEEAVRGARKLLERKNPDADIFMFGLSNPTKRTDFLTEEEGQVYKKTSDAKVLATALIRLYQVAGGKIRFATGSPFPTVEIDENGQIFMIKKNGSDREERIGLEGLALQGDGKTHRIEVGQGNNLLVFPMMYGLVMAGITPGELRLTMGQEYSSGVVWKEIWLSATKALFDYYKKNDKERFDRGMLFPKACDLAKVADEGAFAVVNTLRRLAKKNLLTKEGFDQLAASRRSQVAPLDPDETQTARAYLYTAMKYLENERRDTSRE